MRGAVILAAVTIAGGAGGVVSADPAAKVRPWLGVSIGEGTGWGGVAVIDVFEDTPASLCGLRAGDEIVGIDHVEVHGTTELQGTVGAHSVGDEIYVEFVRGTTQAHCTAELAEVITDPTELLHRRIVGKAIPPFSVVQRGDGTLIDDTTSRGKVLVMALVSTACETCIATIIDLAAVVEGTGAELLIVTADGEEAAEAFVQRSGVTAEVAIEGERTGIVRRYLSDRDDATILVLDHKGIVRFGAVGTGLEAANLEGAEFCAARAERARKKAL